MIISKNEKQTDRYACDNVYLLPKHMYQVKLSAITCAQAVSEGFQRQLMPLVKQSNKLKCCSHCEIEIHAPLQCLYTPKHQGGDTGKKEAMNMDFESKPIWQHYSVITPPLLNASTHEYSLLSKNRIQGSQSFNKIIKG